MNREEFLRRLNQKPGGRTQQDHEASKVEAVGPTEMLSQIRRQRGSEQASDIANAIQKATCRTRLAAPASMAEAQNGPSALAVKPRARESSATIVSVFVI